jgi:hypothetical protein
MMLLGLDVDRDLRVRECGFEDLFHLVGDLVRLGRAEIGVDGDGEVDGGADTVRMSSGSMAAWSRSTGSARRKSP